MDNRSADDFDALMTDEVEVLYGFGQWRGRELHKRIFLATIPMVFTATQHAITNALIEIDGMTAEAEYDVLATHVIGDASAIARVGLVYRQGLTKSDLGWRIHRHEASTVWVDDPEGAMAPCMAVMAGVIGRMSQPGSGA